METRTWGRILLGFSAGYDAALCFSATLTSLGRPWVVVVPDRDVAPDLGKSWRLLARFHGRRRGYTIEQGAHQLRRQLRCKRTRHRLGVHVHCVTCDGRCC